MRVEEIAGQLLYEDNHILVLNKKPSQIVQGDKTGDEPLSEAVKEFIRIRDHKPGNVFIGVVHRLDRPVSGVLILAKTSKALSRLNELLKSGDIHKRYWAVVKNPPPAETGHLVHYLTRDEKKNKTFAGDNPVKKSQRAELVYELKGKSAHYYLLEVALLTGRHHQIRAQLTKIGCPIKGDLKYGFPRTNPDGSIHLHARMVELVHPIKKETLCIFADPPRDPVWDTFMKMACQTANP